MSTLETRHAATVLTPEVSVPLEPRVDRWEQVFHEDLAVDVLVEKRLLTKEAVILALIALVILLAGVLR